MSVRAKSIEQFDFPPGKLIAGKYEILEHLGSGWEGEVYKIIEIGTQIIRAAKCFYPQRNEQNKVAAQYAKRLHKLAPCPIIIHYHTHEFIEFEGFRITCLISEYVSGEILSNFLDRQQRKRIDIFRALQLLHALVAGLESMHKLNVYHGDLHSDNIIIKRYGLGFELKLLDMYHRGGNARRESMESDICDSIRIFYDALGGQKNYSTQPAEVKAICMGLKRSLILKKFKSASSLKDYLENINWQ